MKRFHIYIILALLLSSTLFAQQSPRRDTAVSNVETDSTALESESDSLSAAMRQQRANFRIDSIRAALAKKRRFKDSESRPSLRSSFDMALRDSSSTIEHLDSLIDKLDSISKVVDTIAKEPVAKQDTFAIEADTLKADSAIIDTFAFPPLKKSKIVREKVDIDAVVDFAAKDSLVMLGQNSAFMYGQAKVKYTDIDLAAEELQMDMKKSTVHAVGRPDSVGDLMGTPVFKDKSGEYESKTMTYNFKTGRGYITDVVTQQGEGYLTGGRTKKMEDNTYFMENGKYTTCDDHEHPHFYMQLTKAKVTPKKNVVSGPAYMVLCDVPLPLALPFGYFPFSSKYSSGIIMPTFGDDYQKGFYLRDGGYYFAIND